MTSTSDNATAVSPIAPTPGRSRCRSRRSSRRCCRRCSTRRSWRRPCRRSRASSAASTDVSWVVTAYVVAAAATTPLWGKLGDRHGRKRMLELSLVVFVSSSALCAAAQDITQLIVTARWSRAPPAGGLMTLAMAVVGDLVAPRERGRYQGYIAATFAVATIVGPAARRRAGAERELALGLPRQPAARRGRPRRPRATPAGAGSRAGPSSRSTRSAPPCSPRATSALMLTCIWGGDRYALGLGPRSSA